MQDESKNKPMKIFRCGAVAAAIWVDHRVIDDAVVKVHSIRITKNYRQDNEWKSTTTFATEDLPKVDLVAKEAYRFLRLRSEELADPVNGRPTAEDEPREKNKRPHATTGTQTITRKQEGTVAETDLRRDGNP